MNHHPDDKTAQDFEQWFAGVGTAPPPTQAYLQFLESFCNVAGVTLEETPFGHRATLHGVEVHFVQFGEVSPDFIKVSVELLPEILGNQFSDHGSDAGTDYLNMLQMNVLLPMPTSNLCVLPGTLKPALAHSICIAPDNGIDARLLNSMLESSIEQMKALYSTGPFR